jgi:hypothetical protein
MSESSGRDFDPSLEIQIEALDPGIEWYRLRGHLHDSNFFYVRAETSALLWTLEHTLDPIRAFNDMCRTKRTARPGVCLGFITGGDMGTDHFNFTDGHLDVDFIRRLIVHTFSSPELEWRYRLRDYGGARIVVKGSDAGLGSLQHVVSRAGKHFLGEE